MWGVASDRQIDGYILSKDTLGRDMERSKPTAQADRGMSRAEAGTTRGATGRFEARKINGWPQDGFDRGVRGAWGV